MPISESRSLCRNSVRHLANADLNVFEDSPRPGRRKQGPIQFLENNPIQSSFRVRFMCPKTRRNWLRRPIVRFHPGSSCPQAAALRRSHTRGGYRHFRAIHALVGIRSTFAMPHTSEHPNTFTSFRPPTLECSDVRLGWQETRKRVLELRRPVTVPREICSLGRMNDDRTDLEVALGRSNQTRQCPHGVEFP